MSERAAGWFANLIRSWPFFAVYVFWSIAWWSYVGEITFDPRPWLIWSVITTFITEVDLIVYGIYQRKQSADDWQMQKNQLDTMKAIVALAERIGVQLHDIEEELKEE